MQEYAIEDGFPLDVVTLHLDRFSHAIEVFDKTVYKALNFLTLWDRNR